MIDEPCLSPLLVDTDVVSMLALHEGRFREFEQLLEGHKVLVSAVTVAEIRTFLEMGILDPENQADLRDVLNDYEVLTVRTEDVIDEWVKLRAATIRLGTADDRERRQNDTWIAACALSVAPPLPIVTGNLRDFRLLAEHSDLIIVNPDL